MHAPGGRYFTEISEENPLHFVNEYFTLQSIRMSIFDLVFILLFLTSVVTLSTAAVAAIRGRRAKALSILRVYAICFAIYMGIVIVVALAAPQRIVHLGEDRCFDDWCITVEHADRQPTPAGVAYTVTLQISSRAKRVSQREKGVHVYLIDAQGRRFDPAPDPAAVPIDVLLHPGEAVETRRTFTLPGDARGVGLALGHEGSFCFPGCFIIGDDGNPLHKRTIVPLQ